MVPHAKQIFLLNGFSVSNRQIWRQLHDGPAARQRHDHVERLKNRNIIVRGLSLQFVSILRKCERPMPAVTGSAIHTGRGPGRSGNAPSVRSSRNAPKESTFPDFWDHVFDPCGSPPRHVARRSKIIGVKDQSWAPSCRFWRISLRRIGILSITEKRTSELTGLDHCKVERPSLPTSTT